MSLLQALIAAKLSGSGSGGGGGSDNAVLYTQQTLTAAQQAQARTNVGAAEAETVVEVSGATPTITPANNTIYNCGEVTSLTISNPTATGAYSITFTSGSTPTDLSIDPAIKMPDGFTVEANRLYEINVLANRAVADSWAVSA